VSCKLVRFFRYCFVLCFEFVVDLRSSERLLNHSIDLDQN